MTGSELTNSIRTHKKPVISPARREAVRLLNLFYQKRIPLNILFSQDEPHLKLKPRDRALLLELVFGTIRWQIQIDWILKQFVHGTFDKLPESVITIFRLSLYQLRFLDKIPAYAVVDEAANLVRHYHQVKYVRLVNGVLRNYLRNQQYLNFPATNSDEITALAVKHSFPKWMVKLFLEQFGNQQTATIMQNLNQRPGLTLRINTNRIKQEDYLHLLQQNEISYETSVHFSEFIHLKNFTGTIQDLPGYDEGYFVVQDESAGIVSRLTAPDSGSCIADVCAAPGGKLTHLAQLVNKKSILVGADLSSQRLKWTKDNIQRLGMKSVRLLQADARRLPLSKVNTILIDAPCSGLGVIRKNPDIKIRRQLDDLQTVQKLQWQILVHAAEQLSHGGNLIYSTCTINKEENQVFIDKFLQHFRQFRIVPANNFIAGDWTSSKGWIETIPNDKMDGSFCVRLQKD